MKKARRHQYTKDEIRSVIKLWDTATREDIADELKLKPEQVSYIAQNIRSFYPLPRKRRNYVSRSLYRETLRELRLIK